MADKKGWSLDEALDKLTLRELRLWIAYYKQQEERKARNPSTDQWYWMQIAKEIRTVVWSLVGNRNSPVPELEHFKLGPKQDVEDQKREKMIENIKAVWAARINRQ